MECPSCRASNDDSAKFCTQCGYKLKRKRKFKINLWGKDYRDTEAGYLEYLQQKAREAAKVPETNQKAREVKKAPDITDMEYLETPKQDNPESPYNKPANPGCQHAWVIAYKNRRRCSKCGKVETF